MNAEEARKIADEVNLKRNDSQYQKVKSKITEAANKGEYEVKIYEDLIQVVKEQLEKEGFNISVFRDNIKNDGPTTTIKFTRNNQTILNG